MLECLVALLSISMSVLVVQAMTELIAQDFKLMARSDEKNWQNFSNLLRRELETAEFVSVSDGYLHVKTGSDQLRYGWKSGSDDFRKSNENGQGFQPMIFGLSSAEISNDGRIVSIHLTFVKGGERVFFYKF
ncbi:competence protein ComGF [Lactococcus insecticola]|uniref:Competence protein ComGF n=1 Tax=Pseudolactococcus insecticola TaxID=2709158 RepID=A0A6A0B8R0_9LACT|nr:competence protein ComGF [Lactococcus insecticola]